MLLKTANFQQSLEPKREDIWKKLMAYMCRTLKLPKLLENVVHFPLWASFKENESHFRVASVILVSDTYHYFFHISSCFGSKLCWKFAVFKTIYVQILKSYENVIAYSHTAYSVFDRILLSWEAFSMKNEKIPIFPIFWSFSSFTVKMTKFIFG